MLTAAPSGLGITVPARGGGYTAVCLACPTPARLRIATRLRSHAAAALSIHHEHTHEATR